MPPSCTICHHPERERIAAHLHQGTPLRQIAGNYGLALTSLYRHKQHVDNGGGTAPEHPEQPAAVRPAVSKALIADLRVQAAALRQQAELLRRAHRSYHEYPSDTLQQQMSSLLANTVDALWPAEG